MSDAPPYLRLRKTLTPPLTPPAWPDGITLLRLSQVEPVALHSLLVAGYAQGGGGVGDFDVWWTGLVEDEEFDPEFVFIAADLAGNPAGLAQCWTSGFIKDLVVSPAWRGRGLGEALLNRCFIGFAARGLTHADLKVLTDNGPAIRLYTRVGMIIA